MFNICGFAGDEFLAVVASLAFSPAYKITDANRYQYRDHHAENNDQGKFQMERPPKYYFNRHRRPVLVQENTHQKDRHQYHDVT
jgi:hypothetical protein